MADRVLKICRICRQQLDENEHFHFLNDNSSMLLSKFLDFLPEVDLDFVKNPVSCNQCAITIDQLHEFKKLCMQTESVLNEQKQQRKSFNGSIIFVKNEPEIEMIKEEVLENKCKSEDAINMIQSVPKICRICREQLGENEHFYIINNDNGLMLLSKLLDFLSDIDLDFVRNQISCSQCTTKIDRIHEFKKLCVQTESIIKDLRMQQKSFADVISYVKKVTEIETIKEEFLNDKYEDEPLIVDNGYLEVNTDLPVCIEVRKHQCNICNYNCICKSTLKVHLRSHSEEKPYKCDICGYSCDKKYILNVHLRLHTGVNPYKCDLCNYRSNRKSQLKLHTRTHTGEKQYKCDICDYRCNKKCNLNTHIRTHTREKPYKCDVCDYSCARKHSLIKHLRLHTGEQLYKCMKCNYHSNHKANLIRHLHMHTIEKPYKCNLCEYRCVQKISLEVHLRSHASEKLYKCMECNFRTNYKPTLKTHIYTHTGEKPFKCKICDYSSTNKRTLKAHIISHNGK